MRINKLIISFSACLFPLLIQAQDSFQDFKAQIEGEFNAFKEETETEFERFRRERNEEYAKFMREAWGPFNPSPGIPLPKDEEVAPVVVKKSDAIAAPSTGSLAVFIDEVIHLPRLIRQRPKPIEPIEQVIVQTSDKRPENADILKHTFSFYGKEFTVRVDRSDLFQLRRVSEAQVANAWIELSKRKYTNLVYDCIQIRDNLHLCDWAYLMMLQQMSEQLFGAGTDESVLLAAYIYCQTGYEMRLGFLDKKLCMLVASEHLIYNWISYEIDGKRYYPLAKQDGTMHICARKYPQERPLSLQILEQQDFASSSAAATVHKSTCDDDMNITMTADKGILDFYSSYPTSMIGDNMLTRWAMYANAPVSENLRNQVYPQIRKAVEGCDQLTAVNKILNWIQTGFEYEYDEVVWGYDRAFFPEESMYYPYCDCEDRSILLTRLVRDIIGLNCVLVYYPGHLAAAVDITEGTATGQYIEYEGHKFYIADGTILVESDVPGSVPGGVPVGESVMDNSTAKVIILD